VAFMGGLGYLVGGPIIGAVFMTFLPEMLRPAGSYEPIITAIIIILVIMYLPRGIVGTPDRWFVAGWRWVVRRVRPSAPIAATAGAAIQASVPVAADEEGAE
jgi:branched-chain amino acid transport system permease protein